MWRVTIENTDGHHIVQHFETENEARRYMGFLKEMVAKGAAVELAEQLSDFERAPVRTRASIDNPALPSAES